jgi:hypothetical protein
MPNFDLSRYINPGNPVPAMDITGAYRQWMAQHLDEARLQEQQRQFNVDEQQKAQQFQQEQAYKNRVSNDINARFGLELGEKTNARQYERNQQEHNKQETLLASVRKAAAEGRWNEVEAGLGTLKELGADVGRTFDDEGKPIYHLQGGPAPSAGGESFESSMQKINQNNNPSQGYQFNPNQPQITTQSFQPNRSPFETTLGTVSQMTSPNVAKNPQLDATQQQQDFQPISQTQNPNRVGQDAEQTPGQTASRTFDPYEISSSQLQRMNEMRLNPLKEGIEGAFPNRFQPQIKSLLGGVSAMGGSPESFLTQLQKPMDTAAGLMRAELNSEGQMARAGLSQSGHEDTQSRLLANDGRSAAQRVLKEYGIKDAVDNSLNMEKVRSLILSSNRNANAQGIKELIKMVEGSRITDKDFDIAASGYASDWAQATQRLNRVYQDGLTPDQKSNFNHMIGMYQQSNQSRIGTAATKLKSYISKFRTEPERYGAYNEILGSIPDEYLPDDLKNFDPTKSFGGERANPQRSQNKSVTVTAPTSSQAVEGVKDINSEMDELSKDLE